MMILLPVTSILLSGGWSQKADHDFEEWMGWDGMGRDGVMEMMGKSEDHVGKLESKSQFFRHILSTQMAPFS